MGRPHKTLGKWLEQFREKHGIRYDYSKICVGVMSRQKVIIRCLVHGEFLQTMSGHSRGYGCPECALASCRKTPEERLETKRKYSATDASKSQRAKYYQANKKRLKDLAVIRNRARYHRTKNLPKEKAQLTCRTLVQRVTLAAKTSKSTSTRDLLGYDFEVFRLHIESLFEPWMTWANHGEWHVDHVKPIAAFIAEGVTDPSIVNALDNLRPIAAAKNLAKGSKYLV